MTSYERFKRMYEHTNADRIPVIDTPWKTTIERWHREGMPKGVSYVDFFDLDKVADISVDNSPRFEARVIEETENYVIVTTPWGATLREWKYADSTPEFLDFKITDMEKWLEAKERMKVNPDRIPWNYLKGNYKRWREEGYWIQAQLWFGFDVTHSWMVGTERFLVALLEEPEWCIDMFNHCLDLDLALYDIIWNEGYRFDCVTWPDDLGYKNNQFFSLKVYRELLKPVHKKAADWAHNKGIKVHLHSCGNVNPFIPEFIEIGIDALNPLEVKAGMDPIGIKRKYGDKLVLHGGINAVLWDDLEAIEAEMKKVIPVVKESGGYIFSSDHSVPPSVSLENFRYIINLAKKLGRY